MALKNIMRVDNGNVIYSGGSDGTVSFDLMTKLWENPDPTSTFASQNITLSSDDYDMLLLVYNISTSNYAQKSCICEKGKNIILDLASHSSNGATSCRRDITFISATVLAVGANYRSVGASTSTTENQMVIPVTVYGIKTKQTTQMDVLVTDVSTSASKCMMSDGVTSVEDAIEEISKHSPDTRIEITSYNTSSNRYTFNSDGYVLVRSGKVADNNTQFNVSTGFTILSRCYKAGQYEDNYVFMKKGMSGYVNSMTGSGAVYFIPLS